MSFVRIEELTDEQRALMEQVQTVIREKEVPVADPGSLLPGQVAQRIQEGIGRRFGQYEHLCAWRHYGVGPEANSPKLSDPLEYEAVTVAQHRSRVACSAAEQATVSRTRGSDAVGGTRREVYVVRNPPSRAEQIRAGSSGPILASRWSVRCTFATLS